MPSDTSVSIEEVPCLAFFSAARWNGHAHHRATGAAQADEQPLPAREPQRRHQGQHQRQVGQRDEEDQRHDQPAAQVGGVPVGRVVPFARLDSWPASVRRGVLGVAVTRRAGGVPGPLHRGDQLRHRHRGRRGDPGGRGRVVHRRADLVQLVELLLDPHRARRAGHPLDRQARPPGCAAGPRRCPGAAARPRGLTASGAAVTRPPSRCRRLPAGVPRLVAAGPAARPRAGGDAGPAPRPPRRRRGAGEPSAGRRTGSRRGRRGVPGVAPAPERVRAPPADRARLVLACQNSSSRARHGDQVLCLVGADGLPADQVGDGGSGQPRRRDRRTARPARPTAPGGWRRRRTRSPAPGRTSRAHARRAPPRHGRARAAAGAR